MSSATYDTDILEWSEEQASALRSLARARPDLSNELDWENVAEEIECVGRSEFAAVRSYVRRILIHLIKAVSVPQAELILHWHKEVRGLHSELIDRVTPSMIARLDIASLWRRTLKDAEVDLAAHGQSVTPALRRACPLTTAEIADPDFDFLHAVEKIRAQIGRDTSLA
jgi:Domain of unknown function DUF29